MADIEGIEQRDKILRCPFCKTPVSGTVKIETPFGETIDGGFCGCGTAYVFDRSGRRAGEAYTDALALAYNWDYDAAYGGDEAGCDEAIVRFNARIGKYLPGDGGPRDRDPKYIFIKRKSLPGQARDAV